MTLEILLVSDMKAVIALLGTSSHFRHIVVDSFYHILVEQVGAFTDLSPCVRDKAPQG